MIYPIDFIPLDKEQRTHVSTEVAGIHLGMTAQTLRAWAAEGRGAVRSIKVGGRRMWPVTQIRRVLET